MNGTTNFMLTKMETGADYGEVLAEAQALGYAEGKMLSSLTCPTITVVVVVVMNGRMLLKLCI